MSRTACCFVALGISFAAFAAACGDDDGGGGTGGNGGNGASGGSGGSAGGANVAGEGGSAGSAGGGNAGTAGSGNAGTAGSGNAGSGNAGSGNAGAAGSGPLVDNDAGPDSGTGPADSGVDGGNQAPPDSGTGGGSCPNFATTTAGTEAQNSQPITIVRVTFNGDGTGTVVLRSTDSIDVGGFTLGDIAAMCTGPADGDCVDPTDFGATGQLALNSEVTLNNVPGLDAAEGELVLTSGGTGLPSDPTTGTLAYVAWGTSFVSAAPSTGGGLSWEDRAVADTFWTGDDRIPLTGTEDTFVCGGDTSLAASFVVCTANP